MKLLGKILIIGFLVSGFGASSQSRFNTRSPADQIAAVFTGVMEADDGYVVIGNGLSPSDSTVNQAIIWTIFSWDGNFMESRAVNREEGYFIYPNGIGIQNLNGSFNRTCLGYIQSSVQNNEGVVISYTEGGDTTNVISFPSPYYDEMEQIGNVIVPSGFCSSSNQDSSIFIASSILNPESGTTGGDFYIQRMLPSGEVLWEFIYATEAQPEYCKALLPTENGGVLGILREIDLGEEVAYGKLFELDSLGNLISLIEVPIPNTTEDVVWSGSNDKFLGVGGAAGTDGFLTGRVFKMNTAGEIQWDTVIGNGVTVSFQNQFNKIVKSLDGSGYVTGGVKREVMPSEQQSDSTGNTIGQGWLVKVNEDGEVLWDRTYHYINTPQEEHSLNDLKATSDGGYIFCGESRDHVVEQGYSEGPEQQGWLVKVDQYGCLVEDCQLSDNINIWEQDEDIQYFKAGPIPTGQFLNVYQAFQTPGFAEYQLLSMNGKEVTTFPAMSKGTTLMLDMSEYSSGNYMLVLVNKNEILQRQKIIKQ